MTRGTHESVECHLTRRDMEYRLSIRVGKTVLTQETHRTPTAAAERAEALRRRAIDGTLTPLPEQAPEGDIDSDGSEQARLISS